MKESFELDWELIRSSPRDKKAQNKSYDDNVKLKRTEMDPFKLG